MNIRTKISSIAGKVFSHKVLLIFLLVILILGVFIIKNNLPKTTRSARGADPQPTETKPLAQQTVNRDFTFTLPGTPSQGITYSITDAKLFDEIVVNGQLERAINGKAFLVLDIKIANSNKNGFKVNTRDFVRLSSNTSKEEWLAPDLHNDPVEVQAISTKFTRVGFVINANTRQFNLQVGQIDGQKDVINLSLAS